MKAGPILMFITLSMMSTLLHANDTESDTGSMSDQEMTGTGIGALIGAIIAGPPGAIVGGMTGNFAGNSLEAEETINSLKIQLGNEKMHAEKLHQESHTLHEKLAEREQEIKQLATRLERPRLLPGKMTFYIQFRHDSAQLEPTFIEQVVSTSKMFADYENVSVELYGHADRRGASYYNNKLSKQRVRAVARLFCNTGWPEKRMTVLAFGESQPLTQSHDPEGYIFDRRVQVVISSDQ